MLDTILCSAMVVLPCMEVLQTVKYLFLNEFLPFVHDRDSCRVTEGASVQGGVHHDCQVPHLSAVIVVELT